MQLALGCFLFLFTHIIERLCTKFLLGRYWKNFKELREHTGSFKSILDWAFCQRDGPMSYNQAKIQDLPVWTSELWKNRLTTMLCSEDAHGLLLRSPTPGRVPWLLLYTAAESTEISSLAQGDAPQTCLFHQNLRPTFSATMHVIYAVFHLH